MFVFQSVTPLFGARRRHLRSKAVTSSFSQLNIVCSTLRENLVPTCAEDPTTYCAQREEQKCKEEASCEHNGYRGLMFGNSGGVRLAPTVNADTAEWLSALSMSSQMKRELVNGLQLSVWRSTAEMQEWDAVSLPFLSWWITIGSGSCSQTSCGRLTPQR